LKSGVVVGGGVDEFFLEDSLQLSGLFKLLQFGVATDMEGSEEYLGHGETIAQGDHIIPLLGIVGYVDLLKRPVLGLQ